MNPTTLFDHLKLDPFYPKGDYGKDVNRTVHFLIARNNSTVSIITFLKEKVLPKNPKRLNFGDPIVRKVTPLHLAVMKEREDLIRELLELGADPNAQDEGGWTPYHLTALTTNSVSIRAIFDKYPVKKDLKTKAGDSFEDLLVQTGKIPQKWGMSKVFIEEADGLCPLTEENLSKVGLESYTDSLLFSPETYPFLWKKEYEGADKLTSDYEELFATLPETAPKVVIAVDNEISQSSGKRCLGLKAGQNISFGSAICMYAGPIIPQEGKHFYGHLENDELSKAYDIGFQQGMAIHPFTIGNAARFMNDGFPNVSLRLVPGKGFIAIALKEIKEGEFLHLDYETVYRLKWLGSFLKDKEALLEFFKQMPLRELIANVDQDFPKGASRTERFEKFRQGPLTCFPLWTPSAMLYLSLTNTVTASQWLDLFNVPQFLHNVKQQLKNDTALICWTLSLLNELQKFEGWLNELEQTNPDDAVRIRNYFIGLLDTKDIPKILFGFYIFRITYKKMDTSVDHFIEGIKGTIDQYSWKESDFVFLPKFSEDDDGHLGIVISPQFEPLYRKYGII